ncbi:MAG: hypothetical protein ACJ761_08695 [Chloroflexota bacterium]
MAWSAMFASAQGPGARMQTACTAGFATNSHRPCGHENNLDGSQRAVAEVRDGGPGRRSVRRPGPRLQVTMDEERQLRDRSDELIDAVDDLRRLEQEKRTEPISSDEFHDLADAVTRKSRSIFSIALDQEATGEDAESQDTTIDEVPERADREDRG